MKVYLAGFDVFRPDAKQVFKELEAEAQRLGLTALSPADCDPLLEAASPQAIARHIYQCNLVKLSQADAVVANLGSFRGHEPDSGTVFEVGYAVAKQLPVVGYGVEPGSYAEKLGESKPLIRDADGRLRERYSGFLVEDFGYPLNLMLACSIELRRTASDALQELAMQRAFTG